MQHPLLGEVGPSFECISLDNQTLSVPSHGTAKVVVVDFWASWCEACKVGMPALERLYRDNRRDGLMVVGVSVDADAEQARDAARRLGMTFPVVHDPSQVLLSAYGVGFLPTTVVFDADACLRFVGREPAGIKRAVRILLAK